MQRREGVIGDLGLCSRHGREKRRLAGVGQADEPRVGDELQPKPQRQLLALLAGVGVARRLVGRALEMRIAEAAVAALGDHHALAGLGQIGEQRLVVFREHLRAGRDLHDDIVAAGAGPVLAHAALAALGLEVLLVAIVDERVEIIHALDPDVAALAAVAAVGPAEFDELFAPESDAAVAAVARAHVDLGLIQEFHEANAFSVAARGLLRSYRSTGRSMPRAWHQPAACPTRRKPSLAMTRWDAGFSVKCAQ